MSIELVTLHSQVRRGQLYQFHSLPVWRIALEAKAQIFNLGR